MGRTYVNEDGQCKAYHEEPQVIMWYLIFSSLRPLYFWRDTI